MMDKPSLNEQSMHVLGYTNNCMCLSPVITVVRYTNDVLLMHIGYASLQCVHVLEETN